jgi:quercetin dioxygenase-like cupin family protein
MTGQALSLETHPVHLGPDGTALDLPLMTGDMQWYQAYEAAHGAEGAQGRLVSLHHFTQDWDGWEMHPHGAEVVICIAGEATLIQRDSAGMETHITLTAGERAINPAGVWHTADIVDQATMLFITVGTGTQGMKREK